MNIFSGLQKINLIYSTNFRMTSAVQSIGYLPPQLSKPYIQIDDGKKILIFQNFFEIDDNILIIITPQVIEYSGSSKILFSSKIKPQHKISQQLIVTQEQFKAIVSFNILLFGDLYQTNTARSACKNARPYDSFLQETPIAQLNLLVVPGVFNINFPQIYEYLKCKLMEDSKPYQKGGLAYQETPYRIFTVLFQFTKQTQIIEFFYHLIDLEIYKSLEIIQQEFKTQNLNQTLFTFLQPNQNSNSEQSIQLIRKKFSIKESDQKFYLLQLMKHINQMHEQADYSNMYCQTCEQENKCTFLQSQSKQLYFASESNLYSYPLTIVFLDLIGRVFPQLICEMKFYANTFNACNKIQRLAKLERIEEAISCPSYDQELNYQNLEIVGDSVLKYLTSAMLYEDQKHKSESILSAVRIKYIANYHLSEIYNKQQIHTMNAKIHYKKIRNHMLITINDRNDSLISNKQQADIYEALCGACFVNQYSFQDVIKFFKFTNLGFNGTYEKFYQGQCLITIEDSPLDNFYPLNKMIKKRPFSSEICWNKPLQGLQQQFQLNLQYLQEAMTVVDYERMEFLGDAIIELFVITLVHQECEKLYYSKEQQQLVRESKLDRKILLCPGMLHTAKISLLDNGFMGTMALYYNYHHYVIGLPDEIKLEIEQVISKLQNEQFIEFNKINEYATKIPKVMGDIWESVAACILIEYGWDTLMSIYGEYYKPFIRYIVDNIALIYDYYQEQNRNCQKMKI